jgi:hypothetical protein
VSQIVEEARAYEWILHVRQQRLDREGGGKGFRDMSVPFRDDQFCLTEPQQVVGARVQMRLQIG